jgi:YfiR/HmsC-like
LQHGIPALSERGRLYRFRAVRIRVRILCLYVICVFQLPPAMMLQTKTASEYEIKAAFLYNFAKFVEWPPSVFTDSKQPFNICVLGSDPFGRSLDDAVLGKVVANHPVSLVRARQIQELPDCHILFIAGSQRSPLPEILGKLRGKNVLIVGETEDFASSGGTIQFVLEGNHIRFAINPDAAERAGLKISSKLLALAVVVRDSQERAGEKR